MNSCNSMQDYIPLFQNTDVPFQAKHPHTPAQAQLHTPGDHSSDRDAAALQHQLPEREPQTSFTCYTKREEG